MKNSQKRKEALEVLDKTFTKAIKGAAKFYKIADTLPTKSLKKLMLDCEKLAKEKEQEFNQYLANLDNKLRKKPSNFNGYSSGHRHETPIREGAPDPIDDLPF